MSRAFPKLVFGPGAESIPDAVPMRATSLLSRARIGQGTAWVRSIVEVFLISVALGSNDTILRVRLGTTACRTIGMGLITQSTVITTSDDIRLITIHDTTGPITIAIPIAGRITLFHLSMVPVFRTDALILGMGMTMDTTMDTVMALRSGLDSAWARYIPT